MGMRILSYNGLRIRKLKQWILQCESCFERIRDTNRLFCPSCGNSNLLRIAMYVKDGKIYYGNAPKKINLKGTMVLLLLIIIILNSVLYQSQKEEEKEIFYYVKINYYKVNGRNLPELKLKQKVFLMIIM